MYNGLRLSVRAIILKENRLLLVNAYKIGEGPVLWCAPGGGVNPHSSLEENLKREVHEETGLGIDVGPIAIVNEFHDPKLAFHQVEIFFRASIISGEIYGQWQDPENIVYNRKFFSEQEIKELPIKPSSLGRLAFKKNPTVFYDKLELMVR